jgi:BMFP domain-containing protein YqiC
MSQPLRAPEPDTGEEVAMVRYFKDSTGAKVVSTDPRDILLTGPRSIVQERILSSKERMRDIAIINDAAHAKGTLQSIKERERAVAAREDAVQAREDEITSSLLADAISKIEALTARIDALEAEANKNPDEDILAEPPSSPGTPPGAQPGDGELQTPSPERLSKQLSETDDGEPTDPEDPMSEPPQLPRPPVAIGLDKSRTPDHAQ